MVITGIRKSSKRQNIQDIVRLSKETVRKVYIWLNVHDYHLDFHKIKALQMYYEDEEGRNAAHLRIYAKD